MRCATYARYSTDNQNEESIESQVMACRSFIEREGWTLVENQIYSDYAMSGSTMDRPGLKVLMESAKSKPPLFEKVVVFSLSRLSRDGFSEQQISSHFKRLGIEVVSVSEPLHNMQGSGRKAAEGAIRMVNEVLLAQISEHTIRGQDYAASQGFKTTWAPYGYKNKRIPDPKGVIDKKTGQPRMRLIWVIDPVQAEIVKWIFDEYLHGKGLKRLADKLNNKGVSSSRGGTWAPTAIREMLRNHSYIGWFCLGKHHRATWPDGKKTYIDKSFDTWRVYKNVHDPILPEDLFNKVQERIAITAKNHHFSHAKADRSHYLLTGLIKCGVCGANFIVQATRKKAGEPVKYWHYVCSIRNSKGKMVCSNANRIKMSSLDDTVLRGTKKKLLDPVLIDEVLNRAEEIIEQARLEAYEVEDIVKEKVDLENQNERLINYMSMEDMPEVTAREFAKKIKERSNRIKEIDNLLQRPTQAKKKVARIMLPFFGKQGVALEFIGAQQKPPKNWHDYLKKSLEQLMDGLRKCSPTAVREELKKHIRKIVVQQDGAIEIHGTSQGILSRVGLVKKGDLGSIELGPGSDEPNIENPPPQTVEAYTRKDGVPNRI